VTRATQHPPDGAAVQHPPLDVAGSLPEAAGPPWLPDGVPHLVVAVGQGHHSLHGGFELFAQLAVRVRVEVGRADWASLASWEQLGDIADDVVLGVTQSCDQSFRLLRRPRLEARRQRQLGAARADAENTVGEDLLELPGVKPVGHLGRQLLVYPAQKFGFRKPERVVRPRPGEVAARRVDAHHGGEPLPQQA